MRKIVLGIWLSAIGLLVGCGGGTYDDEQSIYEPTITLNETVVDETDYKMVLTEIVRKTHPDVGRMVEISFTAENKTAEDVYVTLEHLQFDGQEISEVHLAFFDLLEAGKTTTVVTYVQEMENKELRPLEKTLAMELQIVSEDGEELMASYPVAVDF